MSTTSKAVLVLTCFGSLVAFGYCIVIYVVNTFQPLFNVLEAVK